ncbi:hypothetical protein Rfer_4429 (plasmid) [Rhodoferax ferrireducens T118]|uniref:Uncharacterized protein n=1 Tax=Albidiferax ferrireducens (strain ATCC BAA-621 / DSM 15236 / T118) TaxID=338969 RepID=Q21Q30_ALBFT|nr:hypothetical protein [Rhodoferax ferrireducens]ABD72115.1 hypothetical protein Rfer_4429 [Rhodoferax ferrireducens T118]
MQITIAALCIAQALDMHECGEAELARVWEKIEQIRAKQAAKPRNSRLSRCPLLNLLIADVQAAQIRNRINVTTK